MAFAKSNLETAIGYDNNNESKNKSGFDSKTGEPLNENQEENFGKEASEMSANCQESKLAKNCTITTELPPKSAENLPDADACEPFLPPENKRRKLNLNETFDDLVKRLDYNILYLNFMKLHSFIDTDETKLLCLPFFHNLRAYEDFFKMLIDDMELIESKSLDDYKYGNICDKIVEALAFKKSEFKMIHSYKYIEEIKNIVLTVEKQYFNAPESSALSTSNSEIELSTRTNSTESLRSSSSDGITDPFKTHCLQTTFEFIQNKTINTKLFPELNGAQVNFVQNMIKLKDLVLYGEEVKVLYKKLCDELQVLYGEYDLRLQTIECGNKRKHLLIEKIEKPKPPETPVITKQSDIIITSTVMNPPPPLPQATKIKEINAPKSTKKQSLKVTSIFAKAALTNILEFLASEEPVTIFSPNDDAEFWFYKRCIKWGKEDKRVPWTKETHQLFGKLKAMLTIYNVDAIRKKVKKKDNPNLTFHQITYRKSPKDPVAPSTKSERKKRNKKKLKDLINVQGVTENIPADVMKKSLRKKKKDKKKLLKTLNKQKQMIQAIESRNKSVSEESNTESSSRASSVDLKVVREKPKKVNEKIDWRGIELERKGKLREALAIPVQSDKAMRMMRGMGWSGGALGARGNGIIEPIMLEIDQPKGVGFGHWKRVSQAKQPTIQKPKSFPKSTQDWIHNAEQTSIQPSDTDIIVEKTKKLLQENMSFDKIMNEVFKVPKVPKNVPLRSKLSKNYLQNSKTLEDDLQNLVSPQNEPENSENKPQNSLTEDLTSCTKKLQIINDQSTDEKLEKIQHQLQSVPMSPRDLRTDLLQAILDIFTNNLQMKSLKYYKSLIPKEKRFIKQALEQLKANNLNVFFPKEKSIVKLILAEYRQRPGIVIKAVLSDSCKEISLRPIPIDYLPVTSLTSVRNINTYVHTSLPVYSTDKPFYAMRFKISILLSLKDFLESKTDELEIDFTKVLTKKQILYVEYSVESLNMRVKNGGSAAEANISSEILNILNDDLVYIGVMFNHSYRSMMKYLTQFRPNCGLDPFCLTRSLTFTKYYHLTSESNRPKEKAQAIISLDSTSDSSSSPPYKRPSRPIITEADITDDDCSSLSEDTCLTKLPTLPPAEERVNLQEYAKLYNKSNEKDSTSLAEKMIKIMEDQETDIDSQKGSFDGRKGSFDGQKGSFDVQKGNFDLIDGKMMVQRRNDDVNDVCDKSVEYIMCVDYEEKIVDDCDDKCALKIEENKHAYVVLNDADVTAVNSEKEAIIDPVDNHQKDESTDIIHQVFSFTEQKSDDFNGSSFNENGETVDPVDQNVLINNHSNDSKLEKTDKLGASVKEEINSLVLVENEINESMYNSEKPNNIVKIDCDISNVNLDVSKTICDNSGFERTVRMKTAFIVHINDPIQKIDMEKAKEIQKVMSENIVLSKQLPLLKCHGFQNNALIYYCENQESFDWLQKVIESIGDLKFLDNIKHEKMFLVIKSFYNFSSDFIFKMLELYNQGLSTKSWKVISKKVEDNLIKFLIKMDESSINFIFSSNMALYAGVDKVEFSPVWE